MAPKTILIGYGTGRCGTKSMARFLSNQPRVKVTHEEIGIPFWPMRGKYATCVDKLLDYEGDIVGDISPQWLMYLDRLVSDFGDSVKFLWMWRPLEEVVQSFYSYLRHSNKVALFDNGRECFGWYPVQGRNFNIATIRESMDRYLWLASLAEQLWAHNRRMFRWNMADLGNQHKLEYLLDWLEVGHPRRWHMPHVNKRDWKIKQAKKFKDIDPLGKENLG